MHPVKVTGFDAAGGAALIVRYRGPDTNNQYQFMGVYGDDYVWANQHPPPGSGPGASGPGIAPPGALSVYECMYCGA